MPNGSTSLATDSKKPCNDAVAASEQLLAQYAAETGLD
jgi:hypothetical protein